MALFGSMLSTRQTPDNRVTIDSTTGTIAALSTPTDFIKLTGTGAITIQGIASGSDGRTIMIYKSTASNLTLSAESGSATAANRITALGGSLNTTGPGIFTLIYDSNTSRWLITSLRA